MRRTSCTGCRSCSRSTAAARSGPPSCRAASSLYSTLALSRLNWLVKPDRAGELVPALRRDGLRSCALYADAWTNDARLCLENVVEAATHGATVLNRAEVVSLSLVDGRVAGAEVEVDGETVDGARARGRQRRGAVGRRACAGSRTRARGRPSA